MERPAAQASWFFQWLDIDWRGIYFNCAIGNLVNCMKVSDTYAHVAYSIGSCTFKVAYSINVDRFLRCYFGLGWLHQRHNVGERTSITVMTTNHHNFTSHLLNTGTPLLLLFCCCCWKPCAIVYKPSFITFTLPFLRLYLALHSKLRPCSNLTVLWRNSHKIPSVT